MKQIENKDIAKYIKSFNGKNVMVNMVGLLYTDLDIVCAKLIYFEEAYMLKIKGENISLGIDISAVDKTLLDEENNTISFSLEQDIKVIISAS